MTEKIEKKEFTEWLASPVTKKFLEVCKYQRNTFRNILENQPFVKENPSDLRLGCLIGAIRTYNGVLNVNYQDLEPEESSEKQKNA